MRRTDSRMAVRFCGQTSSPSSDTGITSPFAAAFVTPVLQTGATISLEDWKSRDELSTNQSYNMATYCSKV